MVSKTEQIEKIKRRMYPLEADERILYDLFEEWYNTALSMSNRKEGEESPALLALVIESVAAAYYRRGDEGTSSTSLGGQSNAYEEIREKMLSGILKSGLRMYRP